MVFPRARVHTVVVVCTKPRVFLQSGYLLHVSQNHGHDNGYASKWQSFSQLLQKLHNTPADSNNTTKKARGDELDHCQAGKVHNQNTYPPFLSDHHMWSTPACLQPAECRPPNTWNSSRFSGRPSACFRLHGPDHSSSSMGVFRTVKGKPKVGLADNLFYDTDTFPRSVTVRRVLNVFACGRHAIAGFAMQI